MVNGTMPSTDVGKRRDPGASRSAEWIVGATAIVILVGATIPLLLSNGGWVNNDLLGQLSLAREIDDGARLYVDWLDVNPPSIFLIGLAAVKTAVAGVSPILTYQLMVLLAAALGFVVLVRALRDARADAWTLWLTAAAYLLYAIQAGPLTRDFGQREHLFTLFLIPELFVVSGMTRSSGRLPWCFALGFLSLMKPHFIVASLALQASSVANWRVRRSDLLTTILGAATPLALLGLLSVESLRALLTKILGLHFGGGYSLLNESPARMLQRGWLIVLGAGALSLVLVVWAARSDRKLRITAWRAVALHGWMLVWIPIQAKYSSYHISPTWGLALAVGAWSTGQVLFRRGSRLAPTIAVLAALGLGVGLVDLYRDIGRAGTTLPARLARVLPPRAPILVVSVHWHGLCSPSERAPRCIGPVISHIELSRIAALRDPGQRRREFSLYADGLRQRMLEERAELVILSTSGAALPPHTTTETLFVQEFPIFSADEYQLLEDADELQLRGWKIWRRVSS